MFNYLHTQERKVQIMKRNVLNSIILLASACMTLGGCSKGPKYVTMAYDYHVMKANASESHPLSSCPNNGEAKILVVPVWFTDSDQFITSETAKANVREDIRIGYLGTEEETGWHSVKTYYETESGGKLHLDGTVTDWYPCGRASTEATSSQITATMVKNAADWYFKNNPNDNRLDYDKDGDGWLDAVVLIYGAADKQVGKGNDNLWAYCYWCQSAKLQDKSKPGPNVFFWASYDFIYDSATAQQRAGTSYGNGDCSHTNIDSHTLVHEFGHVLGLDDYYDYSYQGYNPAGGFSMQDYNVGGHDPYSVTAYGWSNVIMPKKSGKVTLHPFQTSKEVLLLTPEWNDLDSPFDEYILVELYTPTGLNELDCKYTYDNNYPRGVNETGLRIWHVDARLCCYIEESRTYSTFLHCDPTLPGVDHGISNTFPKPGESVSHLSPLGEKYYEYNELQLLTNSTSESYTNRRRAIFSSMDLWKDGDSFAMSDYASQFPGNGKLNKFAADGIAHVDLGWSFTVAIEGSGDDAVATINLKKSK